MDFTPTSEQRALIDAMRGLLSRYAGAARAQIVLDGERHDEELASALSDAGFVDLALADGGGPLDATLAVIELSKALSTFNVAERLLVGPMNLGDEVPDSLVLADGDFRSPVRYGETAEVALVVGHDEAHLVPLDRDAAQPVRSIFGFPYARVQPRGEGRSLGEGSAARVRQWWRVAQAAEMVGAMIGARDLTLRHITDRHQFGRALGSFQAVQHRVTEVFISIEGARWLTLSAAWQGDPESAAIAAGYAARTAGSAVRDLHQVTGAIGLTTEYHLHMWTLRLEALRTELGGERAHYESFTGQWLARSTAQSMVSVG